MRLAIRESLLAFRRAPLLGLLSITTIAFSLFAFGLFGLVAVNLQSALRDVEDRVEVDVVIVFVPRVRHKRGLDARVVVALDRPAHLHVRFHVGFHVGAVGRTALSLTPWA